MKMVIISKRINQILPKNKKKEKNKGEGDV